MIHNFLNLHRKQFYFMLTVVNFLIMLFLTIRCSYLLDDYHFFFVWDAFDPTEQTRRVASFSDIITSMRNYYQYSGGRIIAHFLSYCFVNIDKMVFNILNAAMYAAMCWLLYRIVEAFTETENILIYPLTVLMSYPYLINFGDNVLWLSGSTNYMWMSVPFLGCINWLIRRREKAGTAERICIVPLFLLSASTNEITGGMLAVVLVLCMLKTSKQNISSLLGYLVSLVPGMCLVLLAPGNTVRKQITLINDWDNRLDFQLVFKYLNYLSREQTILLSIIVFGIFMSFFDERVSWKERFYNNLLFITGICGTGALIFTKYFTWRPMFFTSALLIPAALISIVGVCRQYQKQSDNISIFVIRTLSALCCVQGFYFLFISINIIQSIGIMIVSVLLVQINSDKQVSLCKQIEKVTMRFIEFSGKIHLSKIFPSVVIAVLCVSLAENVYFYNQWSEEYRQFEQQQIELMMNDEFAKATEIAVLHDSLLEPKSRFIPVDSQFMSWFVLEWLSEYYGIENTDYVEEYSASYARFEEMLSQNSN